jgi:hypothetical protein
LTLIDKSKYRNVSYLGQKIRETERSKICYSDKLLLILKLTLHLMSKAERGERNLNRDQVVKLAKFFNSSEEEYISLWLCDKVIEAVDNDPLATQGIKKALTKIKN